MLRTRHRCSLAVGFAAALFLSSVTMAAAETQPSRTAAAESVAHTVPAAAAARTAEYWTPERMAAAIPVESTDIVTRSAQQNQQLPAAPKGPTGPATTGSEPTAGASGIPDDISASVTATKVVGKVFFTASDGLNYVCSASAVNSTNKNMVFTAGHCVHGGPGQSWASNWQFVPYYNYGNRPHGTWWAETLVSFNGWINDGNFGYDLGIVITSPNSSGELVNAVGGLGIQWNYGKERFMTSMGYPAAGAFDGQWQYYCSATTAQRGIFTTDQIKMPCNMTGGSSGGPWIYGKDDNVYYSGYVNGVNSNNDSRDNPTEMRSPYFATWVGDAFATYSSY
ncbi:hypothetical protein ACFWFF_22180 [Streptomyces sp. NPDC060223]|uniref:hypothetical protein n=1 Tax=unclassified Streptomyces TaxID=2593676 RepID=UPI00362D4DE3